MANIKIQQLKYMNNSVNKTLQLSIVSGLLFSARILLLTAVDKKGSKSLRTACHLGDHAPMDEFAFYMPYFKLFSQDYYIQCIFCE